jgi:hypothetical protein
MRASATLKVVVPEWPMNQSSGTGTLMEPYAFRVTLENGKVAFEAEPAYGPC